MQSLVKASELRQRHRHCVTNKKSEKHDTSSSHTDMRHSISTKFCMLIEDLLAIIAP